MQGLSLDSVRKGVSFARCPVCPAWPILTTSIPKGTREKVYVPVHGTVYLRRHGGEHALNTSSSIRKYRRENLTHSRDWAARVLDQTRRKHTRRGDTQTHTRRRYTSRGSYIKSITVLSSATTCLFEPAVPMIPRSSTSPSFEWADTKNAVKTDYRVKSLKQLL